MRERRFKVSFMGAVVAAMILVWIVIPAVIAITAFYLPDGWNPFP
jgi:hypothetical protein